MSNYTLLAATMICGQSFTSQSSLLSIMGMNYGSESFFYRNIIPDFVKAVDTVFQKFLNNCRSQIVDINDVSIIVDAGWSHPGWWARECTVIAIDAKTGLPVDVKHALRGKNYTGSSKGLYCYTILKFLAMEGWGVLKIMENLKFKGINITRIVHDKDSSTIKNVMDVYQDVEESLCLSNL
jgi:hypothetical protein